MSMLAGLTKELEETKEAEVRRRFLRGDYGNPGSITYVHVQEWLRSKESARVERKATESLFIARKARADSRSARRIAIIAIISSAIIALLSNINIIIAWLEKK
jgi:hypothetical protein